MTKQRALDSSAPAERTHAVRGSRGAGREGAVPGEPARCGWCRRVLPPRGVGRPRQFCSQACRQWHWVGQQRAAELRLSEHELIVAKDELDALHDELYVLACAVEDAEKDLQAAGRAIGAAELRELLEWVLVAARPLRDRELQPASARPASGQRAPA